MQVCFLCNDIESQPSGDLDSLTCHLSPESTRVSRAIQMNFVLQSEYLHVRYICGELYQEGVIGQALLQQICYENNPTERRHMLLNHLHGVSCGQLLKYCEILENSAKKEKYYKHHEISQSLKGSLGVARPEPTSRPQHTECFTGSNSLKESVHSTEDDFKSDSEMIIVAEAFIEDILIVLEEEDLPEFVITNKETSLSTFRSSTSSEAVSVLNYNMMSARIPISDVLKSSYYHNFYKKMWNLYMKDPKKSHKAYVAVKKKKVFQSRIVLQISLLLACKNYSKETIADITDGIALTASLNNNQDVLLCRLYCHLADCSHNVKNDCYPNAVDNVADYVSRAVLFAEAIEPDYSSAWAWSWKGWLLHWKYTKSFHNIIPQNVEEEIDNALSRAVHYANKCISIQWLSEIVKVGKAHWHIEMATMYRSQWDEHVASMHLRSAKNILEYSVNISFLNTFGVGYYFHVWTGYHWLRYDLIMARWTARKSVDMYIHPCIKRYEHALTVAHLISDRELVEYINHIMQNIYL